MIHYVCTFTQFKHIIKFWQKKMNISGISSKKNGKLLWHVKFCWNIYSWKYWRALIDWYNWQQPIFHFPPSHFKCKREQKEYTKIKLLYHYDWIKRENFVHNQYQSLRYIHWHLFMTYTIITYYRGSCNSSVKLIPRSFYYSIYMLSSGYFFWPMDFYSLLWREKKIWRIYHNNLLATSFDEFNSHQFIL